MMRKILIITLITYFSIELTSFVVIKTIYTHVKLPQFFTDPSDTLIFPFAYADLNKHWGVWHFDQLIKIPYGCLNLECNPNSVGACDKERTKFSNDSTRCIVLGDSFMEGFGISVAKRVSSLLEKKTGKEFLNFACADMGSTQEYLVYKDLASRFTHSRVMIGVLPANDFFNDNIEFDSVQTPVRYKPYWKGIYPNMELFYYADNLNKSQFTPVAYKEYKATLTYKLRHVLENTTCWFNLLYYIIKRKKAADFVQKRSGNNKPYSGYYDFSDSELSRLKQSLLRVKQVAVNKEIVIFTIPVREDFSRFIKETNVPPLVTKLKEFSKSIDITFVDLLTSASKTTIKQYDSLFFECDIHWNEKGNSWAYEALRPYFN